MVKLMKHNLGVCIQYISAIATARQNLKIRKVNVFVYVSYVSFSSPFYASF